MRNFSCLLQAVPPFINLGIYISIVYFVSEVVVINYFGRYESSLIPYIFRFRKDGTQVHI